MYCSLCAAQNPDQGRFCITCGQPLAHARSAQPAAPALPYAEFVPRFLARLIDALVLSPLLLGWIGLIAWFFPQIIELSRSAKPDHPEKLLVPIILFGGLWFLVSIAANWLYHAILDSSERQGTVGKRVMGLAVTTLDGKRISFARASVRWLCNTFITSQTLFIGYVMVAFTAKKQTLHDLLAETLVLDAKR